MRRARPRLVITLVIAAFAAAAWIVWAYRSHSSTEVLGPTLLTFVALMFAVQNLRSS